MKKNIGAGKYCTNSDSFKDIHPALAVVLSQRLSPDAKSKSIDNCYLPNKEKIPGYYSSTPDLIETEPNQRKTLFSSPALIPDLSL